MEIVSSMRKKIAIINPVGFEGGGITTLCLQYAKLGIDVIVKNQLKSNQYLPVLDENIHLYSDINELVELCGKYNRLLFVNLYIGKITNTVLDDILTLKSVYPNIEICYIHCTRHMGDLQTLLPICNKHNFMFTHIYSLLPYIHEFKYCDSTFMNINAFTPPNYNPVNFEDRLNVIFSSGRVEAFKGTLKYFNSIDFDFLQKSNGYTYLHEGANFNFHKRDSGISCPPQLLSLFDTIKSPKIVKQQYAFKRYGESPEVDKFNIYPSYNVDDVYDRWKNYYAGICCILGTKSNYVRQKSLFEDRFVIADVKERNLVEKQSLNWGDTLEYADIEKIFAGVPTLFSRKYSELIGFNDFRLIYDSFLDIPRLVANLSACYDDIRIEQYKWLVDKLNGVNANIIEQFTKEF